MKKKLTSKFVIPECFYRESRHANKGGFTLLEIIVVLIIIGIMASIAIPNLFSNVTKSRAGEAFANISALRPNIEACIAAHPNSEATCNLGYYAYSANFSYWGGSMSNGNTTYLLQAIGLGWPGVPSGPGSVLPGPFTTGDYIAITRSSAATPAIGTISCRGYGVLASAC